VKLIRLVLPACLIFLPARSHGADPVGLADIEYVQELRRQGLAPLAVEYLRDRRSSKSADASIGADLDFEWGASLLASSEVAVDLADREKLLDESREAFEKFGKLYPNHPNAVDAMVQQAGIELGRARVRVLQAQLPANEAKAIDLTNEARQIFAQAEKAYVAADQRITKELDTLTGFLDPQKDKQEYRRRERLFEEQVEARFQSGLAAFLSADSYATVDDRLGDPRKRKEFVSALKRAKGIFEKLADDHRREVAGLYGSLWAARCLTALGDHKNGDAILESLLAHDNRDLERFQREVFHFRLLSLASQGDHAQVARLADDWLKQNSNRRREPSYQGVQWVTARSLLQWADEQKDEKERERLYREADDLLNLLSRSRGPYSAQASREQLALARRRNRMLKGNSFQALSAQGLAQLDEIPTDASDAEKARLRGDAIAKLEEAIGKIDTRDPVEDVSEAKIRLVYAYFESGDLEKAIARAEEMARGEPEVPRATDAALLAISAYARLIDQRRRLPDGGSDPNDPVDRWQKLAELITRRWPKSSTADQARLLNGKLAFIDGRWDDVVAAADAIETDPLMQAQGKGLSGGALWRQSNELEVNDPQREKLRQDGLQRLREASGLWPSPKKGTGIPLDRVRHEIVRGEAELTVGHVDQAKESAELLTVALGDAQHPLEDPQLRSSSVAVVVRSLLARGKTEDAKAFFEKLAPTLGTGESKGVTGALLAMVRSIRSSSGADASSSSETKGLSSLLDQLVDRSSDLSPRDKLYLADAYLSAGNPAKGLALIEPLLASLQGGEKLTARLLQARARSQAGQHQAAVGEITQLLKENVGAKEVIVARGEILESAKDYANAIKHWQWYLDRLKRVQPRPVELYEVTDRICRLALSPSFAGPESKKILAGALRLPVYLVETDGAMPAAWKQMMTRRIDEIKRRLGSVQ
jgi:outer membrane protein assembly factor BamD (BamD/ComL family)